MPTVDESGVPGYVVDSWQAIFAPAKTPPDIVRAINAGVVRALAEPALVEKLAHTAYTAESSSPDQLGKFQQADTAKWKAVIMSTGLKID